MKRDELALKRAARRARDVGNLGNWLANGASIARAETEYIEDPGLGEDLMAVEAIGYNYSQDGLEGPITDALVLGSRLLGQVGSSFLASVNKPIGHNADT